MGWKFILSLLNIIFISGTTLLSQIQDVLSQWQEGYLDIHHISTGRGNATYFILPDGTTMIIDAGDISETHPRTLSPRNSTLKPNGNKSAPQWIIDYIRQFAPGDQAPVLDYALVTHYHDDHFGEWDETRTIAANSAYRLTGIMAVGNEIPISVLLDRGYTFPINLKSSDFREKEKDDEYHIVKTLEEYWKFITWHTKHSAFKNEVLIPGSASQIKLKYRAEKFQSFKVRNIAVNGIVWSGFAENEVDSLFKTEHYPGENPLSTCIKVSYGRFDYFTGGDINGVNGFGESDMNAIESHVAPVIGPVDVATLNHHGNRDSQNAFYVRTLRPRIWIGQSWSSDHPGHEVLTRITSKDLYPGPRDLFTTDMLEANEVVIGEQIQHAYRNRHGHILIRVYKDGNEYEIFVLNDLSERREIIDQWGPYNSR